MNQPPRKTMILGHPVTVAASALLALALGYGWYVRQDNGAAIIAVMGLALLHYAYEASQTRREYKLWQREWADMDGRRRLRVPIKSWFAAGFILAVGWYCLNHAHDPMLRLGFAVAGLATVVIIGGRLLRALRRRRSGAAEHRWEVVKIVVARPAIAVPTLNQAIGTLPPHCKRLMGVR